MSSQARRFEDVQLFAIDVRARRILIGKTGFSLVDWETGQSTPLPKLEIPRHHHLATQNLDGQTGAASLRALVLNGSLATLLTTEGVWRLDVDQDQTWTRVAGHPTDPPSDWTVSQARDAGYPAAFQAEGYGVRLGGSPVALSNDGSTVVGAPNLRGLIASDHELHLWSQLVGAEPVREAPRFRSAIEALALSSDGNTIAFSEGRDFRVLSRGEKKANRLVHDQKMFISSLALSPDGKFAAANGRYPNDLRTGPLRAVLWDVKTRAVLAEWSEARQLGFITDGAESLLVLSNVNSAARTEFVAASDLKVRHVIEGLHVRAVEGTLDFLAYLDAKKVLTVEDHPERRPVGPAIASAAVFSGWEKQKSAASGAVNRFLLLFAFITGGKCQDTTESTLDAVDALCWNALFVDVEGVGSPTLWQLFERALNHDHLGTMAALTLAECNGWSTPRDAVDALWSRLKDQVKRPNHLLNAALVAWGRFEDFERINVKSPEPPPKSVSFVAKAVAASRGSETQELVKAWNDLLDDAPALLETGRLRICELMLLARAIHVQVRGGEPLRCFDWFRAQVASRL